MQSQWRGLGATYNPVDVVDTLTCPLLIVHGTLDQVAPMTQAMELKSRAPGADLALIEGADHGFNAHRQQLVETVVNWLSHKL